MEDRENVDLGQEREALPDEEDVQAHSVDLGGERENVDLGQERENVDLGQERENVDLGA